MTDADPLDLFRLFTEIGIVNQLGNAHLERHLPAGYLASHFGILNHLVRIGEGQTPLVLARAFQLPKPTMTRLLAQLELDGLVAMTPHPLDGRSKMVFPTDAGRAFRDTAIDELGPSLRGLMADVDLTDLPRVLTLLAAVRRHLDEART